MHRTLTILSLLLARSASAVCPEDSSPQALAQHLTRAEQAWTELDGAGFSAALDDVVFTLPCLTEPITPILAARTHRALALQAFGDGQELTASAAFRAAHAASPAAGNPQALLPSGHAALTVYENSRTPVQRESLDPPPARALLFDGAPSEERPLEVPTVAQVVGDDGAVRSTRYVNPGQQLPPYDAAPIPVVAEPTPLPTEPMPTAEPRDRRALSATLGTVTTLAALSTAGLVAGSVWSHQEFQADHPSWGLRELDARRERTNTLTLGAAAAGAVTATAGITWIIVR